MVVIQHELVLATGSFRVKSTKILIQPDITDLDLLTFCTVILTHEKEMLPKKILGQVVIEIRVVKD